MKNKRILSLLTTFPLLMSMTPGRQTFSPIANDYIYSDEILFSGEQSSTHLSNVLNNIAATIDFSYEIYQMNNSSYPTNHYVPAYTMIYRSKIMLSNNCPYKGGLFNAFDGNNPICYIKNLSINATFQGLSSINNYFQSPQTTNGTSFRVMRNVNPHYDSRENEFNCIGNTSQVTGHFSTATNLDATSYAYTISQATSEDFDHDTRLIAEVANSISKTNSTLTFSQSFSYGYSLSSNGLIRPAGEFFSGPAKTGQADDSPFDFSIYGAMNFESDTQPSKGDIQVVFNTIHGSSIWLDNFSRSSTLNLSF